MTTLKSVDEAVEEYCGEWQLGKSIHDNTVRAITQDRQAHCDELVQLIEEISPTKEVMHDHIYIVEKTGKEIKEEALTIVKEVYSAK